MSIFQDLRFLITVNHFDALPKTGLEVAFAGRSNAGKSSAINTLANQRRLAFVSKTPGRTQHINYFDFGHARYLVDLPGYGFAAVPEKVRTHWGNQLRLYLRKHVNVIGLVLIMDARHPLTELDWRLLDWFHLTGKPIHCLLTKSDKLSYQNRIMTLRNVQSQLGAYHHKTTVQLFSSLKKQGVPEVEAVVGEWFKTAQHILLPIETTNVKYQTYLQ